MHKDKSLTLEALRVMDAIDRRKSFAAAADELRRVPSALSYTMQKLEEELDMVIFDRSGHRTKFTPVGRLLLERGRTLLDATSQLVSEAQALSEGWEPRLTVVSEAIVPIYQLFPLAKLLAEKSKTQLSLMTEVLAGSWEKLESGRADIVIGPKDYFRPSAEVNFKSLFTLRNVYVAVADHPIHQEPDPIAESTRLKYRAIAIADTARERPSISAKIADNQLRLTVSSIDDKHRGLLDGIGIGSMPFPVIKEDVAAGRLKIIGNDPGTESEIIMAWRRDQIGQAKALLLREIPKLLIAEN